MTRLYALVVCFLLLSPKPAAAFTGVFEDWVSGQNQILAELLALEAQEEHWRITQYMTHMGHLLQASNEVAASVRFAKDTYDYLRGFNLRDYAENFGEALIGAFPELTSFRDELLETHGNIDAGHDGTFFDFSGRSDRHIQNAALAHLNLTTQTNLYSTLWPNRGRNLASVQDATPLDRRLAKLYEQAGQRATVARQKLATARLLGTASKVHEAALASSDPQTIANSISALANTQSADALSELVLLKKQNEARKSLESEWVEEMDKLVTEAMQDDSWWGLKPGAIQ